MYQLSQITQLPIEITREIFTHLLLQHVHSQPSSTLQCRFISAKNGGLYPNHATSRYFRYGEDDVCICWQLDLLSVAMVCKSWYLIGLEIMQSAATAATKSQTVSPWLPLVNHPSYSRNYPFRSRLVKLLKESELANLAFHQQVRHLVIDFASFDTIRREKSRNTNTMVKKRVHHANALSEMIELIKLCTQTERLDIICDAGFTNLLTTSSSHDNIIDSSGSNGVENNSILHSCKVLQQTLMQQNQNDRIKRLDFIGFNPIQRCPCCAGKEWDQYLLPLMTCLSSVETLVLQNVLPSVDLFQTLNSPRLTKIVFYKSMVTVPLFKKTKTSTSATKFITSVNLIPQRLWKQIKHVEIYEDIEDVTTWRSKRYLTELVNNVHDLESFVLQFDTKEGNEKCLSLGHSSSHVSSFGSNKITNCNSPLYDLRMKCKNTLRQMTLINVPDIY